MTMPEMERPEESSESEGMAERARYRMMQAMGQMMRLPKMAAKQAFDKTLGAMNPEVATHLIQSNRELLLAVRSFVDYEIRMTDRAMEKVRQQKPPETPGAETPSQEPPLPGTPAP